MTKIREKSYKGIRIDATGNVHSLIGEMIEHLHLPATIRILDLGSGYGAFSARLKDMGFLDIEACEIVPDIFHVPGILCQQVDLNQNHFDAFFEKKYDLIVALEILEHLDSTPIFFMSIINMLEPGGLLILSTPNVQSWYSRILFLRKGELHWFNNEIIQKDGHISPIFDWQVEILSRKAGFSIVDKVHTDDRLLLNRYIFPKGFFRALFTRTMYLYLFLHPIMRSAGKGELRIWVLKKD
jgi:cyclopropane fatty-acyl-phospholipid synthase-like methyltransferase